MGRGGGLRAGSPWEGGRVLRGETAPKKEGRAPGVGAPRTGAQRGMGVMRGGRNPEPRGGAGPQGPGLGLRLPSFAGDGVLGIL